MSEALILGSTNPQYDKRLFFDMPVQYQKTTRSEHVVYKIVFCFDIQNNICTQDYMNLYLSGNSMNNLSSHCGLNDLRMRASDSNLPVHTSLKFEIKCVSVEEQYEKYFIFDMGKY